MPQRFIDFTVGAAPAFPFLIGTASETFPGRVVFQIVGAGTFSLTPKVLVPGVVIGSVTSVPYTNRATGATVAAGTAITAAGIYEVDATGVRFYLDGSYTSGACAIYPNPLEG